jgi:hypothetical protein
MGKWENGEMGKLFVLPLTAPLAPFAVSAPFPLSPLSPWSGGKGVVQSEMIAPSSANTP